MDDKNFCPEYRLDWPLFAPKARYCHGILAAIDKEKPQISIAFLVGIIL